MPFVHNENINNNKSKNNQIVHFFLFCRVDTSDFYRVGGTWRQRYVSHTINTNGERAATKHIGTTKYTRINYVKSVVRVRLSTETRRARRFQAMQVCKFGTCARNTTRVRAAVAIKKRLKKINKNITYTNAYSTINTINKQYY